MHELGFRTWVTDVFSMATDLNLDLASGLAEFRIDCKDKVRAKFRNDWCNEMQDLEKNPILRTYAGFKLVFGIEPYLKLVKEHKYRIAISRLRCSSHTLAIERRRYERPKPPIEQRVCMACRGCIENEVHFVTQCDINSDDRRWLESKVSDICRLYITLSDNEKFVFLNTSCDSRILTWYGKFLHKSFKARNIFIETYHAPV